MGPEKFNQILRFGEDFCSRRISTAGSDGRKPAQLAQKNSSLYTWGFPEPDNLAP